MKTNTINPEDDADSTALSPTTLFKALSAPRRQHVLDYLLQKPGSVDLGDLAEYVALREGDPTKDLFERVLTDLYHTHLPHLADAGLVRYDWSRETVTLVADENEIRPFVGLASEPASK